MDIKKTDKKKNLIVRIENNMRSQLENISQQNDCRVSDAVRCLLEYAINNYYADEQRGTRELGERIKDSFRKS